MTSFIFFLLYFIPACAVFLLALLVNQRRYERRRILVIAALLPLALLNGYLFNNEPGDLNDVPVSLALDALIIYLCYRMVMMRETNTPAMFLMFTAGLGILATLLRLNADVQVIVANFIQVATAVNLLFITQLILVAFLAVEYKMHMKGWIGIQPINYFEQARENRESHAGSSNKGTVSQAARRKLEHRDR